MFRMSASSIATHGDGTQLAVFSDHVSRKHFNVPACSYPASQLKLHILPEATFRLHPESVVSNELKCVKVGRDLHEPSTHDPPLHVPVVQVAVPLGSYPDTQLYVFEFDAQPLSDEHAAHCVPLAVLQYPSATLLTELGLELEH